MAFPRGWRRCPPPRPSNPPSAWPSKPAAKNSKLTQEDLANETDLHQRWICNVETGKRNPSYASLRRLAAGLDLTASELIARAEQIEADTIEAVNAAVQ